MIKFTLARSTALPVLAQALKTCKPKSNDVEQSLFFIKEDKGILTITSFDDIAQQSITLPTIDIQGNEEQVFAVSGQAMVDFFKQFPDEEAVCEWNDSTKILTVTSTVRTIKFEFPTFLVSDKDDNDTVQFVPLVFNSKSKPVVCDAKSLADAFQLTSFAASTDSSMAPLTAVSISVDNGTLVAQSSDNFRISIFETDVDDDSIDTIKFLLPHEAADILSDLWADVDEITVEQGKRHIRFIWDETIFTSRIEAANFPDLNQYIGDTKVTMRISRKDLLNALKLAGLLAKDSYVILSASSDGLEISTEEADRGASTNVVPVQAIDGEEDTCVSYKFFLKGVEVVNSPWIDLIFTELSLINAFAVCIVDGSYRHYVFPAIPKDTTGGDDN